MNATSPTAAIVVIGNEVLSGRTRDANINFLAVNLNAMGIRVAEARVVPDSEDRIIAAVEDCRTRYDYVFTTGGIGPTHDDITATAIAKLFGVPVVRHPEAEARLRRHYKPEDVNPARLKMAEVPQGAVLIDNVVTVAPGFRVGNVFVLAGVPRIVEAMWGALKFELKGGPPPVVRTVTAEVAEGKLAAGLSAIQDHHPNLEIGSYPYFRGGRLGVSIVIRGEDKTEVDAAAEAVHALMRDLGGAPFDGEAS